MLRKHAWYTFKSLTIATSDAKELTSRPAHASIQITEDSLVCVVHGTLTRDGSEVCVCVREGERVEDSLVCVVHTVRRVNHRPSQT